MTKETMIKLHTEICKECVEYKAYILVETPCVKCPFRKTLEIIKALSKD